MSEDAKIGDGNNAAQTTKRTKKSPIMRFLRRIKRFFELVLFSNLTMLIVILNIAALVGLMFGIMLLNQTRDVVVDARLDSLTTQGKIIAGAIAASATVDTNSILIDPEKLMELQAGESLFAHGDSSDNWDFPINPERVSPLLRRVISPATTRARIYDRDANLLLDSRQLYSSGQVLSYSLPNISNNDQTWYERFSNWLSGIFFGNDIPQDSEMSGGNGMAYPEVLKAIDGTPATAQRRSRQGELIVSVAVPIQRSHTVVGVLLLSTVGSDIDNIVRAERMGILKIFAVIAAVMLVLSLFLASTIATPLRKLAAAADRVRNGTNKRVEIPDFSSRQDEVGHLSTSIRDMTEALYMRIEAIERFAADVSHELKNPLTSLRSAVETLPLAKTDETRGRLLEVIQHDVRRLDRLITDISDASRLDAELAREASQEVNIQTLLDSIVLAAREVRKNKTQAKIEFDVEPLSGNKRYIVAGHDLRLGQVVSNLIENARSFIPVENGIIRIKMKMSGHNIILTVEDNGPGIGAENIERIFERFYTDRPGAESFGQNSGLGLSISRQIIEAHEGTLTAENIIDPNSKDHLLGARFIIKLPVAGYHGKPHHERDDE
ncbi:stimulus-sensing domain-containing protein [Bartonella sp. HY761]|uniref:stimulus-sensing domain-containing protein n=1 Tax=Bartonella sp. HY761 TaxID=2979330 RepID=UPI003FA39E78